MSTPNMNLSLPTPSSTLGPTWASMLTAALDLVDAHDHTSGKGVPIPTAGLELDEDLGFNGYNATLLRSARFSDQAAALAAATDLGCIYAVGGDLYWNNGDGTAVQITDGGSLSATSLGGISGLPSGTASAAFAAATFTWRSATNQAATMDVGPVVIHDTAASAKGVTVKSPTGLAADFSITLPAALPGSTSFLRLSSSGVLSADAAPDGTTIEVSGSALQVKAGGIGATQLADNGVTTAKINASAVTTAKIADANVTTAKLAANAVTRAKLESVGQQVSSASAGQSTSSTSWTNVTNLSVSITTTGRPVIVACVSDAGLANGDTGGFRFSQDASVGGYSGFLRVLVSGSASTSIGQFKFTAPLGEVNDIPASSVWALYAPAAGTYTLQLQMRVDNAAASIATGFPRLVAYEL